MKPVSAVLVLGCWAMVLGGALTAEAASPMPRASLKQSFLVTQVPAGSQLERQSSVSGGMLRADYGEGARIILVQPQGRPKILTAGFQSACDPDLSFDGTRFLFAAKRTAQDSWNIYEMALDGSNVRQITRGIGDCRSPSYLSSVYRITENETSYRLTFVRAEPGTLNEHGSAPITSLYSCKLDGSDVERATYNLSNDLEPAVLWDGRLVFGSWQRTGLENGLRGRIALLGANVDGTDLAPFCLDGGKRIKHMPCATTGGLVVFVETDTAPWDGAGRLACVQIRRPLQTYRTLTDESEGMFHSPSPLPDGRLLVSRRAADGTGTHDVYRFDPASKRLELLYDDPNYHDLQARVVAPRSEPDGRSSVVAESDPHGKLYCLDLYTSDLKDPSWMRPGTIKKVRVIEGLPRKAGSRDAVGSPYLGPRRILGEVPVAEEEARPGEDSSGTVHASINLEVPANTPIQLQILDEQGMALRSCRWVWARNHQSQGCIGCHEDGELTPNNWQVAALWKPSVVLDPPVEHRETIDFRHQVMPLVAKKCLSCHDQADSPPRLTFESGSRVGQTQLDPAQQVYRALLAGAGEEGGKGKYVHPGQARTSPLVWHLFGRNTSRPWDGSWANQPAKPIAPGSAEALTDADKQVFVRWIDLGAAWDSPPGKEAASSTIDHGKRSEK